MAIRALSRLPLPLVLPRISPNPLLKVQSFTNPPNLLSLPSQPRQISQFAHQTSLASLLQRYGFPQSRLNEFIQKNRFLLNSGPLELENCIKILLSFGFSQNVLLSVLTSCPRVLNLGFLEEWRFTLSELGFSSLIQKVLEQSGRFRIELNDFRQNVVNMKEIGFSDEAIIKVFDELPVAFIKDPIDVRQRIEFFVRSGIEKEEFFRICYLFPKLLRFGVDGKLRPLFEEFRDLGFVRNEIRQALLEDPELLLGMEVGELSRCMKLIRSLKCRLPVKEKILSRGQLRAGIDVKLRIDFLCKFGLIRRDAFKVLYVEPRAILYGLQDIEQKIGFLLHKMGHKMGCSVEHLVEFPEYLGVNMEKQIIPRYRVVKILRSKDALGFEVGLKHLIRLSRHKFYNLFVKLYPECENKYGRLLVQEVAMKPRHSTGLWKMFKPEKFPKSTEDRRNIKMFMDSIHGE